MTAAESNPSPKARDVDVLIIGAGFGGCYSLHKSRELGLTTHVFEASDSLGGVWSWNTYPGARVDCEIPYYQFSLPSIWRKWNWSERFPGREELMAYFRHVDDTLDLSKDITYSASVSNINYDSSTATWHVSTAQGHTATCRYLICATGSSYKPHFPDWPGLHSFEGQLIHSTRYPANANTTNTRVAIIGSGATAVQCTQEIAKTAAQLTVFIRTASISLPMVQRNLTPLEQEVNKSMYRALFAHCRLTKSGLGYDTQEGSIYDISEEQREELWEQLWARGGFNFNQANYRDYLVDQKANAMMYEFWAKKTRPRIKDVQKQEFLVPRKAPFAFGTKRSSLEQDYYECLDQGNVSLVDLKANKIMKFTERGLVCEDGTEREFDTIVLATGFDSMTGSLTSIDFVGRDGRTMKDRWKEGVFTHLGMCVSGCPNMFMVYGPQGKLPSPSTPRQHNIANPSQQHQQHSPTVPPS